MDLYTQTQRLLHETENSLLLRLESAKGQAREFSQVQQHIQRNIDAINQNCAQLEKYASRVDMNRRRSEKQKVEQLRFTVQSIMTSLGSAERRHENDMTRARERDDLINRKFTANSNAAEYSIGINQVEGKHNERLGQAHSDLDNIIGQGVQILENLQADSALLKGVKTKMLNIANVLGLSDTVMRLINKRTTQDKFLLYGLMIVSTLIMYGGWRYFRG